MAIILNNPSHPGCF